MPKNEVAISIKYIDYSTCINTSCFVSGKRSAELPIQSVIKE